MAPFLCAIKTLKKWIALSPAIKKSLVYTN